jgi:maltooligosyltrehalose trehalohydrolase
VFRAQHQRGVDGAVLSPESFVLRFFEGPFMSSGADRLLIVNLGRDLVLDSAPQPLLAPPENMAWALFWSSEDPRYGGSGTPPFDNDKPKTIPAHSALVMIPCQR